MDILDGLQRRLGTAVAPTVARHTVAGIFATLRRPGINADALSTAITQCLTKPNKIIAQEAADQLLSFTLSGGLPPFEAVEFLLGALASAGPATAPPLSDALCRLVLSSHDGSAGGAGDGRRGGGLGGGGAPPPRPPGRWSSHPLVAALLTCPSAATQLLTSTTAALGAAAAAAVAGGAVAGGGGASGRDATADAVAVRALDRTWSVLEPFYSFVLLQRHPSSATDRHGSSALSTTPTAALASPAALATAALAPWLHGQLVRLGAGGPLPPVMRGRLLTFLTIHLALGPRAVEADRMRAVQSTSDLLDVLEAVMYEVDGTMDPSPSYGTASGGTGDDAVASAALAAARCIGDVLLQLAFEILMSAWSVERGGGGGGGQEVVAALVRLQGLAPGALTGRGPALALLTLVTHGKELQGLHLLLHKSLQPPQLPPTTAPTGTHQPTTTTANSSTADAAFSLQPLLSAVAFGTTSAAAGPGPGGAAWPAHLAAVLQRIMAATGGGDYGSGDATTATVVRQYGDLCLLEQCRQLLLSLWAASDSHDKTSSSAPPPCDLVRWLRSLELALRQRRRAAAVAKAVSEQLPFATRVTDVMAEAALGAVDAHPAVTCMLAALLVHPEPWVRVAAAAAARQLVQLLPASALPLLPLIMFQLHRGGVASKAAPANVLTTTSSTHSPPPPPAAAAAQLALLQLLPVMAADAAVMPYVLRVLQPMLQPGAPTRLRCLGLKLLADMWLIKGRGWPQLEAALNGLSPPGASDPPAALRVTRAALLRAVCERDPERGVELVSGLQAAVRDGGCPPAAALGLEALGVMAEEDVVDFYTAFKVVHRWHPGLPPQPQVAAAWVALLTHGSLDMEAHTDKAVAVLDILWAAARHSEALVRAAAYDALSHYPLDLVEKLEALRPLSQYTAPLLTETDPRVSGAAKRLAATALQFEHANRRRLLLTQPASDTATPPSEGPTVTSTTADTSSASTTGGKGAAYAAAATAREARALRGRLLGRIPKLLLPGTGLNPGSLLKSSSGGGGGGGSVGFHPGAALFVYARPSPPPMPPGSSAAAAAAAAKRAAADAREAYGQRLRDALRRLVWRGHWHARLAVQAWSAFVRRWMYDTGITAAEAAAVLVGEWEGTGGGASASSGAGGGGGGGLVMAAAAGGVSGAAAAPAAVLEGVGLAAGGLCVAAEGLPEAEVSVLTARLLQQAQAGRSSAITRSALIGAALAASRLHPTDWATRQQVLSELRAQLLTALSSVVRSAAATAMAALAGSLAADPAIYICTAVQRGAEAAAAGGSNDGESGGHSREVLAVSEMLSYLSCTLGTLSPQLAPAVAELAASGLPAGWPSQQDASYNVAPKPLADESDEQEVLSGTAVALVSLCCDINRAHGLSAGALKRLMVSMMDVAAAAVSVTVRDTIITAGGGSGHRRGSSASVSAAAAAALEATAYLAPEAMRYQQVTGEDLSYMLSTIRELCNGDGAAATDGRLRGAAAHCLGCVAVAALRHALLTSDLVLELGLLDTPSASTQSSLDTMAAAAVAALVGELGEQATGGGGGGSGATSSLKGQHTAAARTGAVAGLAAVLLPPAASVFDALAPLPSGAVSSGLLAQPEYLVPAKAALRALEGLATEDTDSWVAAAAAFHLAAVSAAVAAAEAGDDSAAPYGSGGDGEGGKGAAARRGGDSSGASGPKALSMYPPEGAVRPLVNALVDRSRLAAVPRAALANMLLALAAAPALPAADWPNVCRTLMSTAAAAHGSGGTTTDQTAVTGLRLQSAVVLLALTHGSVSSLGLGALLEELVAPARFAALPSAVQALLLARLPALLRSLAVKRAAAVVHSLPGLLASVSGSTSGQLAKDDDHDDVYFHCRGKEGEDGDEGGFPWSSAAGLDDPVTMLPWLTRVRQAFTAYDSQYGGGGTGRERRQAMLSAHCWVGLLGVCRGWQSKDAVLAHRDITQAAHTAITSLAAQLPPLPGLLPGEAVQMLAWAAGPTTGSAATAAAAAAVDMPSGGDDWTPYGPCGRPLASSEATTAATATTPSAVAARVRQHATLWSLTVCCLRCLRPDFLTQQLLAAAPADKTVAGVTSLPLPPRALAALQLRCVLVATGHVSYRELMPVRTVVAAGTAAATAAANTLTVSSSSVYGNDTLGLAEGDPLLVLLVLALAGTPQAFQVQVLLQTLDGARLAPQLGPPLELAAALVAAALSAASGAAAATAPELSVALTSRRVALESMPYNLIRLLSRPPWSSSTEAVAAALLAVVREGLRRGKGAGVATAWGTGPGKGTGAEAGGAWSAAGEGSVSEEGVRGPLGVVLACLRGLRDALPPYSYDQMHTALGWRALAGVVVEG